jgi:glycine betaine/proline transport system ATP-binding protein
LTGGVFTAERREMVDVAVTDSELIPLVCEGVWKVFGPDPATARRLAEAGQSRQEIVDACGQVVGVRDVSFRVRRGETFVVMGLSGSGKSTLIRCLSRLVEPTYGSILFDGHDICKATPEELIEIRRHKLSMVFQHFGLFPHRKVIDNVAYGLEIQGMSKTDRHARAQDVLESVGLGTWGNHYPLELSGGMQQRVGLARALAVEPEILFFDEPFSALDPLIRRDMQNELLDLQQEMKRTIVFITHDFSEALKLGDHIAIMKDGGFDQIGTPEEVVTDPATDYVREFTRDVPRSKVIRVGKVMTSPQPDADADGRALLATATLEEALPRVVASDRPLAVVDESGSIVGSIDRRTLVSFLGEGV